MKPHDEVIIGPVYDVVVVGAGGAGMTAALAAARNGLDVVLIEKSSYFGGSTARSGGGVWIPGNYAVKAAGEVDADDEAESRRYLDSIVGEVVPKIRRDTYLERGPEMMEFLRANTPVRFKWVPLYADYLPEAPGGRARGRTVEPVPLNAKSLGDELDRLHPPYGKAPANLIITQADFRKISLGTRTIRGPLTLMRASFMRLLTLLLGKKMFAMGNAIAIGLRQGLIDTDVPVFYDTELTDLIITDGRVSGVRVVHAGVTREIAATRGVILGSGGFEKNLEMREKYQPQPTSVDWTTGAATNQGAGILAGIAAGAQIDLMDDSWWGPTIPLPNGPWFCLAERNLPGSMIVNAAGKRYMNEALPYVEAVHEIYKGEETGVTHVPSWMIIDQRYRNRYLFAGLGPRQPFPGRWLKEGVIKKSSSIAGLAEEIGVPVEEFQATIDRFNGFAATGVDEDFGRGESAYDKYYSDPRVKPNPSLHAIDQGPFYAVKIVPGDLGTKGGLVTDERARVLRADGSVIEGLYAAGNCSSAVMGNTYAGPGATIGPAMTFGYLAALDIAQVSSKLNHRRELMPIDPDVAIGARLPSRTFSWTTSDVLLYHLGIGAGSRPGDNLDPRALRYTLDDDDLQVLPSFALVAPSFHETDPPSLDLPGCDITLAQVVHGAQSITVNKPLPTSGTATLTTRISDVWDKGKAAVIWQEAVAHGDAGEELWTARSSIFVKGEGGWGGNRGDSNAVVIPERKPDVDTTYEVTPAQAMLYRLCGDRNPLHADPAFAQAAGFPAPILHGLCSYGIVLRNVTDELLGGDAAKVASFGARFAGVVFPGETIRVQAWDGDEIAVTATIASQREERNGAPVLADCSVSRA